MDALLSRRVYLPAGRLRRRPGVPVMTLNRRTLPQPPEPEPEPEPKAGANAGPGGNVLPFPVRLQKARNRDERRRWARQSKLLTPAQAREFYRVFGANLPEGVHVRPSACRGAEEWKYGVRPLYYVDVPRQVFDEHRDEFGHRQVSCGGDLAKARDVTAKIRLYQTPGVLRPAISHLDGFKDYLRVTPKAVKYRSAGVYRDEPAVREVGRKLVQFLSIPGPDGRPLGEYPLHLFSAALINFALQHLPFDGKGAATQTGYITVLGHFFKFARKEKLLPPGSENPVTDEVAPHDYATVEMVVPKDHLKLNVAQTALVLGVDEITVRRRIGDKKLRAEREGRGYAVAVAKDLVAPFVVASLPRRMRRRIGRSRDWYTAAEWAHLRAHGIRFEPPKMRAALDLIAYVGDRVGEVLGWTVLDGEANPAYTGDDPDEPAGWVRVARQDDDGTPGPRKSGGEPYSIALSQRAWAVWEYLRDAAVETFEASREQGLLAADAGPVAPLLPQRNGKPWEEEAFNQALSRATLRAGFGERSLVLSRTHALRHLRATLLCQVDPTKIPAAAAALGVTVATFLEDYVGTTDEEVDLVSVRAMHALDQGALLLEFEQSDTMPTLRRAVKLAWDAAQAGDMATVRAQRAVAREMVRRAYAHFGGEPRKETERELIDLEERLRRAEYFTDPSDAPSEGVS
jgi:integrase